MGFLDFQTPDWYIEANRTKVIGTMEPVTDETRKAVWDTLCDLEWNKRYYSAMADSYRRRHRWLRFAILAVVLIEAAILYAVATQELMFYIGAVGGVLLAALTIWDVVHDYAENAAILRITAFACDDLNTETGALWRSVESGRIAGSDADLKLNSITGRKVAATQRVRLGINRRFNWPTSAGANRTGQAAMPSEVVVERRTPRQPLPPRPPDNPRPQPPPRPAPAPGR